MAVKIHEVGRRGFEKNVMAKIAFHFCSEMHSILRCHRKSLLVQLFPNTLMQKISFFLSFRVILIQG